MDGEILVRVELVRTEPGHGQDEGHGGWVAHLSTRGLGELDNDAKLTWQPRLSELVTEIHRVVDGLRAWFAPLRVEITLNGSSAAAQASARSEARRLLR